ncbi:hypothetical protein AYI68_g794 [Smittium mucronatum]|uniref:Uncharacterized protein n=1 Tax=Smittium mucronatum TaxID=133383 RepID=A0A1R0H767_9FUNG|nr:hypothetical protein AYI68_g794 [Smittium mucronatum]
MLRTYGKRVQSTNRKTPPGIASSRILPERGIDRNGFPKSSCCYVSAVLKDRFLLFRDGTPLESLSSESLSAVSTTPNQE